MEMFANGDEASRWLGDRLDTLQESISRASELQRLVNEGSREVLIDIDADPALFSRDAADRMRRYTSRISQATLRRLEQDGFQLPVLERSSFQLLGLDASRGMEVLLAMVETLRAHTDYQSDRGTALYGEGRQRFSESTREIGRAMDEALSKWSTEGPGRFRKSRLPWRRRRAGLLRPTDDDDFRQLARKSVQRHLSELERALKDAGEGSIHLATAKYYGDIVTHLTRFVAAGANLRERGPSLCLQAEQRLGQIRREASRNAVDHSADVLLMDDATLDTILDRLGVSPDKFLQRVDLRAEDLAEMGSEGLEEAVRAWVEAQLGGLASPSLSDALGGGAGHGPRVRKRLLQFLAQGQPLMLFNDDLPLQFDGGLRAQCFVVAETNDASLAPEFRAACHQMGLPDPHLEILEDNQEGLLQLRVVQFAAGMPLFAQIDRLMEMIDVHRAVLIDETEPATAAAAAAGHLRDMPGSKDLPGLIPHRIERAFRQERALIEDPSGALSINEALEDEPHDEDLDSEDPDQDIDAAEELAS